MLHAAPSSAGTPCRLALLTVALLWLVALCDCTLAAAGRCIPRGEAKGPFAAAMQCPQHFMLALYSVELAL